MSSLKTSVASLARYTQCLAGRLASQLGLAPPAPKVSFVVEKADWSIRWDGLYIADAVNTIQAGTAGIVDQPPVLTERVVHFGSQYMWTNWGKHLSRSNRFVVSFFHGKPEDGPEVARHIDEFMFLLPRLGKVVTAASSVEARLLEWGVPREKLVCIPIGVDTQKFDFTDKPERIEAKRRLGLPLDRLCIGSFQKDGVGWGAGMEPKLIKGPDVFLEAVAQIAKEAPAFVLLTGPARGYVKAGLEKLGVPYKHIFLANYLDIVDCYKALDLYLMTSREEGGPKAVMECMATGTPIVATRCGMVDDLLTDRINGAVADVGDSSGIAERGLSLLQFGDDTRRLLVKARQDVLKCDWREVGAQHWRLVYEPLLKDINK